jgi:hypothetical protein
LKVFTNVSRELQGEMAGGAGIAFYGAEVDSPFFCFSRDIARE